MCVTSILSLHVKSIMHSLLEYIVVIIAVITCISMCTVYLRLSKSLTVAKMSN
jgi:hypothetical protein